MMILNSVLLVCVTLVSVSLAQAPNKESTSSDAPYDVFNERLRLLSSEHGGQATDCAATFTKFGSVDDCARKQFQNGKPFFFGYHGPQNARFVFAYGLAADAARNVFAIVYQERSFPPVALNRHMRLMDDNHTRVTQGTKPVQGVHQQNQGEVSGGPLINRHPKLLQRRNPSIRLFALLWRTPQLSMTGWCGFTRITGNMENSTLQDERCQEHCGLDFRVGSSAARCCIRFYWVDSGF
jgi:hypothetical protein